MINNELLLTDAKKWKALLGSASENVEAYDRHCFERILQYKLHSRYKILI